MSRIILSLPIRRTSDSVLYVNTSPLLEVFRVSTYTTGTDTSSTALVVSERGGLTTGDALYVGTNAAVNISAVTGTGPGTVTIDTALTWSNNTAVVVKRKAGSGSDAYATIYDDPNFATSLGTPPFTANTENVWTFFAKPGRYGVRYSNSADTTLRLDTEVSWGETDWVQVSPSHDSPTAGIQEAINKLSSAGGTVSLGAGTFTISATAGTPILMGDNTRIIGSGVGATIIKIAASNVAYSNGVIEASGKTNIEIAHLTIDGNLDNNTADTAPDAFYAKGCTNAWLHHVEIKNMAGAGISFWSSASGEINSRVFVSNCVVSNCKSYGIRVANSRDTIISNNVVRGVGNHGIALANGQTDVLNFPRRSSIIGNVIDRSVAPTQGTQSGFLIGYSWSGEDISIANNVCLGAIDVGQADGIGWGRLALSQSGKNISIIGNSLNITGAFGIDVPPSSIVSNNIIHKAGTIGIALANDDLGAATDYVYGNVVIADNIVVDVDATDIGVDTYAIAIGGAAAAGAVRTIDSLIITGNSVSDSVGRMDYALSLQTDANQTITNCIITNNDFSQAAIASIKWWQLGGAVMSAGITKLRVRDNITVDAYSGSSTLASGTVVARNTAGTQSWPKLTTILFGVTRTSIGVGGATDDLGVLVARWDSTTPKMTITSHDVGNAQSAQTQDVSTVWWEFLGTAA